MTTRPPAAEPAWHPHFGAIAGLTLARWLADQPPATTPRRTIVIASEERSGSEWLCQMMQSTGVLGRPSEYLNTDWMRGFVPDYPADVPAQLDIARRVGTTVNGVLSIKLHPWAFDRLSEAGSLSASLPRPVFVRLARQDLLGQAISLVRARQTQSYHAHVPERSAPAYDDDAIRDTLVEIARNRARWDLYCARNGLDALPLDYETLGRAPGRSLRRIARLAGVRVPLWHSHTARQMQMQRDAESGTWRQRYLARHRDLDRLDRLP